MNNDTDFLTLRKVELSNLKSIFKELAKLTDDCAKQLMSSIQSFTNTYSSNKVELTRYRICFFVDAMLASIS